MESFENYSKPTQEQFPCDHKIFWEHEIFLARDTFDASMVPDPEFEKASASLDVNADVGLLGNNYKISILVEEPSQKTESTTTTNKGQVGGGKGEPLLLQSINKIWRRFGRKRFAKALSVLPFDLVPLPSNPEELNELLRADYEWAIEYASIMGYRSTDTLNEVDGEPPRRVHNTRKLHVGVDFDVRTAHQRPIERSFLPVLIGGKRIDGLPDTNATRNAMTEQLAKTLGARIDRSAAC
ncbi:hypothetical protein F5B22DRAFT_386233 [Xylaria bambusicola]|uniref:uncharacterized protein n=1 Tax=Xylaria bambusicola TaxID=326684 RepID=UPI0020079D99|nr:uncharacterized protein F5B22DRAFT_386233 [Xylaria bambusicola]KAI0508640.1 hypothetical protein F5B22DRAFT_386233 [Xylaria bambusicola]